MSYVNNIAGSIDNINTVGEIESITTNGNVTTITATAQIVSSNVIGRLGFAQVNISSEVKDVLVNGESVLDEQGNANIEIPEIEEIDPTVPKHIKGITEENIENWNNKSNFSGNYEDLNNKPELFSGDYNDLENKPKLPNKTSDLYNDSGYITAEDIPEFPEIPEIPQPIEYKADDNIIIEDETIKGYTNTGYKVIDEDIKLQDITPTRTTGTNKQVYTDAEISIIYDGSNKIRRAVNGIDFDVISLSYTCKSMFYNPNIKRIYGLANGYFLYSDDNGETWNTKQSTYANGSDYITQAQPHVSGLTAVNKSTKTLYGLGDNFIQNSSIKSTISPDFVTQFSQYQFIWCNSSGTFKYGAGSQEGTFASLSGVTVNMLKTVNGRQIVGVKNSNKFYMIKNLSGVTGNEWIPYDLPNVCTVNDIIFNPYDETYYIFTDVNTYYKTKDLTNPDSFESVDKDGLRGVQGHFTLMGIQMTVSTYKNKNRKQITRTR